MDQGPNVGDLSGPGAQLRSAREAQGLSVGEVAAQLRLDDSILRALENDDFDKLPAPIFVKGYLRNLAQMLNLPTEELWQSYSRVTNAREPELSMTQPGQRPPPKPIMGWVVSLLGVLALVGLAYWYSQPDAPPIARDDVQPTATAELPQVAAATAAPVALRTPAPRAIAVTASPESAVVSARRDAWREETVSRPSAPPARVVEPVPEPVDSASALPVALSSENLSAGPGQVLVQVSATQDSWVSIRDASQERLVRDLIGAGEIRSGVGTPPFTVNLGYAPGVTILIDGQPYDHSRFLRSNNTARFNLVLN